MGNAKRKKKEKDQSGPAGLKRLRTSLGIQPDGKVLEAYIGNQKGEDMTSPMLKDAILVTIHRKWLENPPYSLTEIGIATYDKRQVKRGRGISPGPHAENLLKHVWFMHLRLIAHAHLPTVRGEPEVFHFETSVFVTPAEAQDMLHQIWTQYIDDQKPELGFRPVIYLSFSNNNSLSKVRRDFDFFPDRIDTTVATLDVQTIAEQSNISRRDCEFLDDTLRYFNIGMKPYYSAGDAAAYITIVAFLSTLRKDLYHASNNRNATPGQFGQSSSKPAQDVVDYLVKYPTGEPPFGIKVYCSRCGSREHMFAQCPETDFICSRCESSHLQWRRKNAWTHKEGLCMFRH